MNSQVASMSNHRWYMKKKRQLKNMMEFQPRKNKHTLLHTLGFSHPAVETNIKKEENKHLQTRRYLSDAHVTPTGKSMSNFIKLGNAISGWT